MKSGDSLLTVDENGLKQVSEIKTKVVENIQQKYFQQLLEEAQT